MADQSIAVQQVVDEGAAPTFTNLNATDIYFVERRNGRVILYFKNSGASPAVITFDVTQTPDGLTVTDPTVSVPATNGERVVGNFGDIYEIETGANAGKLKFTCDQATGASVAVLEA